MSSQGCPEIGKLHKCKLKTCLTSCACLSRWSFFYSRFSEISKSIITSFVNYISIKIPLRHRYNSTLFIILQQRKAYLLLTATHSTQGLRKRERGEKKPALKHFTEDEERHFFQCCRKKKSQPLNQAISGRIRPEPRHCYSFSSTTATESNKLSFTSNFAAQT